MTLGLLLIGAGGLLFAAGLLFDSYIGQHWVRKMRHLRKELDSLIESAKRNEEIAKQNAEGARVNEAMASRNATFAQEIMAERERLNMKAKELFDITGE